MKKRFVIGLMLACAWCFVAGAAQAQLSKAEKKALKSKLKQFKNLDKFNAFLEEHEEFQGRINTLQGQVKSKDEQLGAKNTEISELRDENDELKSAVASLRSQLASKPEAPAPTTGPATDMSGIVFKVQIGAFKERDMQDFDGQEHFTIDKAEDIQKFSLGAFRDYWEADSFKKHLREMGVKDAWIVSYKDGQRVPIKDVLEGII